jgi:hypothetical protein
VTVRVCILQEPELCAGADDVLPYTVNVPLRTRKQWEAWQLVGVISARTTDDIPAAINYQRQLILDWAIAMGRKSSRGSSQPIRRAEPFLLAWTPGAGLTQFGPPRPLVPSALAACFAAATYANAVATGPTLSGLPTQNTAGLAGGVVLCLAIAAGWEGCEQSTQHAPPRRSPSGPHPAGAAPHLPSAA